MYCKHCGKQISDDSTFCQFCGGRVDIISTSVPQKSNDTDTEEDNKSSAASPEVIVSTKESSPLKVEVSKKGKENSSTIANEIVGNLKMIGFAFGIFVLYMICFMAYRSHDARPLTENGYLGESYYDPVYVTKQMLSWEQHYAIKTRMAPNYKKQSSNKNKVKSTDSPFEDLAFTNSFEPISSADAYMISQMSSERALEYANQVAKEKDLPESLLEEYQYSAKEIAKEEKESFFEEVSYSRQYGYEEDLKQNAIYAAIISVLLMILGRYLIKLVKWVHSNKTK